MVIDIDGKARRYSTHDPKYMIRVGAVWRLEVVTNATGRNHGWPTRTASRSVVCQLGTRLGEMGRPTESRMKKGGWEDGVPQSSAHFDLFRIGRCGIRRDFSARRRGDQGSRHRRHWRSR